MPRTFFYIVLVDGAEGIEGDFAAATLEDARKIRATQAAPYGEITRVTVDLPIRELAVRIFNREGFVATSKVIEPDKKRGAP